MMTHRHAAIALISGAIAFTNIAAAADLDGTVFAQNQDSWQHQYQNMSQAERNLVGQINAQPGSGNQYRGQNANGSGDGSQTRTRSRTHSADGSGGGGGGKGRGRH